MFWLWGQFLDHDIDLTPGAEPVEALPIAIPVGDPWFDPAGTGLFTLAFERSAYHPATGTSPDSPRRQINEITSWIDASNVYGSDAARATALRTLDGTGRLRSTRRASCRATRRDYRMRRARRSRPSSSRGMSAPTSSWA